MNARTSLGAPAPREPTSIAEAQAERVKLIPQILELQNILMGITAQAVSSVDYHRRRAETVSKSVKLQQRAGYLRRWIAANQAPNASGVSPQVKCLAAAYNLLVKIQESDTGSPFTQEIETCLESLEKFVPIGLIADEAKAG